MTFRKIITLLLLPIVSACTYYVPSQEEVQRADDSCLGEELCTIATIWANGYNETAGTTWGHGISVREAKTDGKAIFLTFNVDNRIKNKPTTSDGSTAEQQFEYGIWRALCSVDGSRRFFELGGEIRYTAYLPSDQIFSRQIIKSCIWSSSVPA